MREDDLLRSSYLESLKTFALSLENGWRVHDSPMRDQTWRVFRWRAGSPPTQGVKIHVSVAAVEAPLLFDLVLPLLADLRAPFKLPATVEGIVAINSGELGETQVGKVVTIYPPNCEEAVGLARELDRILPVTRGPVVPSDLPLRKGGAVYLRYGVFSGTEVIRDSAGRVASALRKPDGSLEEDGRSLTGNQPDWAPDLSSFCTAPEPPDYSQEICIDGNRYTLLALLYSSSKSKVFLGLDIERCESVVIKSARAGIGGDLHGFDERDKLSNDHAVLKVLASDEGLAPCPLGFSDGDPAFLVMEDLQGETFAELPRPEQIRRLPCLAEALSRLHAAGFAHRDLKLSNVMVNGGSLRLIDFGLSAPFGSTRPPLGGTQNYFLPEESEETVGAARDHHALGICVGHAILGTDPAILPPNSRGRLLGLLRLSGAHHGARIVCRLTDPNPSLRSTASCAADLLRERGEELLREAGAAPRHPARSPDERWCKRAAREAALCTRRSIQAADHGHLWESRHPVAGEFPCEGINVGAAGIILGLSSIDHALQRTDFNDDIGAGADWLASRPLDSSVAGLFTGNAGVALALAVAGKRLSRPDLVSGCRSRLDAATSSPAPEFDLFSGSAGIVWAGCMISDILGEEWPLQMVDSRALRLLDAAETDENVIVWPSPPTSGDSTPSLLTGAAHGSAGIAMSLALWAKHRHCRQADQLAVDAFRSLRVYARAGRRPSLPISMDLDAESAPVGNWCHGEAGYLWCILQAYGDSPILCEEANESVGALSSANTFNNPTYCHGVSGQLELWRMLSSVPRFREMAVQRAAKSASVLRLLNQRLEALTVWGSEEPKTVTPDLWVGFMGPATALALYSVNSKVSLLSSAWMKECTRPLR